ncbi:alkylhydroperoxidase AhpD family core domain-containing protein [Raineyella antarctica]|uniref:Alkylhydroperoxidase AhpD family core domain-containing protein n=1 Tax=Raineyella antarctica TaxID=1577474 RepID=A0A1G6GHD8_9ACTN|nr:carboxymuconolactone decarboxylase family protein [Raineyella antarctica]SDB80596.1 alkylhydroperoxidase AhpD family core domain-containing protein [Raineyella antarctica]
MTSLPAVPASPLIRPKQRYSLVEGYRVAVLAARSLPDFRRRKQELGLPFIERIMLAVTEVNGCPVCSYGHARMALEAGLPEEEIRMMLDGDVADAPASELPAIMFGQHYADTKGHPDPAAWQVVIDMYGPDLARGILGAIRMIMWGNAYGIALSGLQARKRGEKLPGSSLAGDVAMTAAAFLQLPVVAVHAVAARLAGRPLLPLG